MGIYFRIISVLMGVFLFCLPAISEDQSTSTENRRWGITTKELLEEEEKEEGDTRKESQNTLKKNQDEGLPDDKKIRTGEKPKTESVKSKTDPAPGRADTTTPKSAPTTPKDQKQQIERIKWENEKQKTKCEAYLGPLKENFLKARHYSIQGQACGTAEYSQNFLKIVEKCKQDCPENFLAYKGYTKRIVRNLRWLEKLGAERCTEVRPNVKSVE